jgi:hypothetical protein
MTAKANPLPARTATADAPEWAATLLRLRARYEVSRDLFSAREMARLHFLKWLIQTGRMAL